MIIRIPIFRPAIGFHTYTLIHAGGKYHNRQVLERLPELGYAVVREETRNRFFNDVRYSLVGADNRLVAFIRGYPKSAENFYVERIERVGGKESGIAYFRHISPALEKDLRVRGFRHVTLLAPVKLASILSRKFDFEIVRGIDPAKLARGWRRRMPWKLVLLRKD